MDSNQNAGEGSSRQASSKKQKPNKLSLSSLSPFSSRSRSSSRVTQENPYANDQDDVPATPRLPVYIPNPPSPTSSRMGLFPPIRSQTFFDLSPPLEPVTWQHVSHARFREVSLRRERSASEAAEAAAAVAVSGSTSALTSAATPQPLHRSVSPPLSISQPMGRTYIRDSTDPFLEFASRETTNWNASTEEASRLAQRHESLQTIIHTTLPVLRSISFTEMPPAQWTEDISSQNSNSEGLNRSPSNIIRLSIAAVDGSATLQSRQLTPAESSTLEQQICDQLNVSSAVFDGFREDFEHIARVSIDYLGPIDESIGHTPPLFARNFSRPPNVHDVSTRAFFPDSSSELNNASGDVDDANDWVTDPNSLVEGRSGYLLGHYKRTGSSLAINSEVLGEFSQSDEVSQERPQTESTSLVRVGDREKKTPKLPPPTHPRYRQNFGYVRDPSGRTLLIPDAALYQSSDIDSPLLGPSRRYQHPTPLAADHTHPFRVAIENAEPQVAASDDASLPPPFLTYQLPAPLTEAHVHATIESDDISQHSIHEYDSRPHPHLRHRRQRLPPRAIPEQTVEESTHRFEIQPPPLALTNVRRVQSEVSLESQSRGLSIDSRDHNSVGQPFSKDDEVKEWNRPMGRQRFDTERRTLFRDTSVKDIVRRASRIRIGSRSNSFGVGSERGVVGSESRTDLLQPVDPRSSRRVRTTAATAWTASTGRATSAIIQRHRGSLTASGKLNPSRPVSPRSLSPALLQGGESYEMQRLPSVVAAASPLPTTTTTTTDVEVGQLLRSTAVPRDRGRAEVQVTAGFDLARAESPHLWTAPRGVTREELESQRQFSRALLLALCFPLLAPGLPFFSWGCFDTLMARRTHGAIHEMCHGHKGLAIWIFCAYVALLIAVGLPAAIVFAVLR